MRILAFDCAGNSCAAAVLDGGAVRARRFAAMERGHSEALMPMIEAVLAAAGQELSALDLIGVTVGPGGFTGLRIGLAAARGLALASGVPLVGVTSFAAVAAAVPTVLRARPLAVALESKRAELYLQLFAPEPQPPALVAPAAWEAWLPAGELVAAGDGAARLAAGLARRVTLAPGAGLPDAADVARLAGAAWRRGERTPPLPLYLRAPDTTPQPAAAAR